jgi:AraC family transcriptional regulator of adaptative response/methylated-DNA-[protein]-cysteine methyltransferase
MTMIHYATGEGSLGAILVARSERGVCAILLGDDAPHVTEELEGRFPDAELIGGDAEAERLLAQVTRFVEHPAAGLELPPLDIQGTVFQQRVWREIRKIPAGTTASYAEVAGRIGAPDSARAVARACGANRIALAIPCHRVVASDGALSGYRWGIPRKQLLLERESALSLEPVAPFAAGPSPWSVALPAPGAPPRRP